MSIRFRLAGIIGNFLGHYDSALFTLLAPFIAPLFFDGQDPLTALILTYAILPLGFITRPLGSLFFGWVGDRWGRKHSLFCSLLGMAFITVGVGCLPLYKQVGIWAPIGLALGRMLQNFCAAGESTGGALFILEHTPTKQRSIMSSFYGVSVICGYLIASGLVTWMSMQGMVEEGWRVLFWLGGLTGILGVFLRWKTEDAEEFVRQKRTGLLTTLKENKGTLGAILLAAGFSYTTYSLPFTLMNGYIPLVSSLTKVDVMQVNTLLLIIDMLLLPCFGYLTHKLGKEKVMMAAASVLVVGAIPLFALLDHASFAMMIAIRLAIVTMGVAFSAPYHAWALERVPPEHRYTILCVGYSLGSQLIGTPAPAVCLWIYQKMGWVWAPGLYLMGAALAAFLVVRYYARAAIPSPAKL